jgi:6-phosphogluconolactonase (cycloisomerase 2 family)
LLCSAGASILLFITGCSDDDGGGRQSSEGAVYAMTNALDNNEIVAFSRAEDGTLAFLQRVPTGGGGSGVQLDPSDSLGSQGALVLNGPHDLLFAVNTESLAEDPRGGTDVGDCQPGSISSFFVDDDGRLSMLQKVPSGGLFPASLAVSEDVLYVLNAGGPGLNPACGVDPNITAFSIENDGELSLIEDSTQEIDPGSSPGSFLNCDPGGGPFPTDEFRCGLNPPAFPRSPGQVGLTPEGDSLVVTVKGTNSIYVFPLNNDGTPGEPTVTQAEGPNQPTYFGFGFDSRGNLIVSEPFGATATIPAAPFSAVSSFDIRGNGELEAISSGVPNGRGTACWVALDPDKQWAYVANNATSDVSSYEIGNDGSLTLLEAEAAEAELPNDMATASNGDDSFLYVLDSGSGNVGAFAINEDGSLSSLGVVGGLPVDAGAQGLAAY